MIIMASGVLHAKLSFVNRSSTFIVNNNAYSKVKLNQIGNILGWSQSSITKEDGYNSPALWQPAITPGTTIGNGATPASLNLVINTSNAIASSSPQVSSLIRTTSNALLYHIRVNSNAINGGGGSLVRALSNAINYGLRTNSNALINQTNLSQTTNTRLTNLELLSLANLVQIRLNSNALSYATRTNSNAINSLQTQLTNISSGTPIIPPPSPGIPTVPVGSPGVIVGITSKPWSSVGFPILATSWSVDGNFLAVAGRGPDTIGTDTDLTIGDELRVYNFNSTANSLTGMVSQSWSTVQNSIQTLSWLTNQSSGNKYLAVGGQIPDLGTQGTTINQTDALRIYQFNQASANNKLSGVVSKSWSLSGDPVNTLGWIQDNNTGRMFLAVGGEGPDNGSETNINATDGLRLYEFKPNASTIQNRLIGITSKGWSSVGDPVNAISWVQDTITNRIFLAVGGTNPNAGAETNINVSDGIRIYEFSPSGGMVAVASVNWSTFGTPVNTVAFAQDPTSNRIFLAAGGQNPNIANNDPNINPGHEFRLYELLLGTTPLGPSTLVGITSKDWSTQGFPITSISWSNNSQFITVGGSSPNTRDPFTRALVDTSIGTADEIRLYSFTPATNTLAAIGSKPWSTFGTPVYSIAWNPSSFIFAVGGGAANLNTNDTTAIGLTDQLRLYQIPDAVSGGTTKTSQSVAAQQAAQKKKWISWS